MELTSAFVLLFSLLAISLAAEVYIYDRYSSYSGSKHVPAAVSQLPWEYRYELGTIIRMRVLIINEPLDVTGYNVTYSKDGGTPLPAVESDGKIYFTIVQRAIFAEFKIYLNLHSTKGLCSSLLVAEGRTNWPVNRKPNLNSISPDWCRLEVDVSDQCVDPFDTESTTTTTLKPSRIHLNSNNVAASPHTTTETTIIKVNTNGTYTATVTIIFSTIGVVVVLLVVIAIWIYWSKRNTPQLPTISPSDPIYVNMLFRKQCDQEITEIEQHHYEEIEEYQNDETENQYEEIN